MASVKGKEYRCVGFDKFKLDIFPDYDGNYVVFLSPIGGGRRIPLTETKDEFKQFFDLVVAAGKDQGLTKEGEVIGGVSNNAVKKEFNRFSEIDVV